ncbi:MAG TPA: DUF4390 domain-containing protein [Burkholderiales bacterium]|nr:DUF4390 domain-containing protein [Burkholderiales bacterium]
MQRMAYLARLLMPLCACLLLPVAQAQESQVQAATLRAAEDGLVLDADIEFELTPRLAEVLSSGVPLYFVAEFELERDRWYWFDEKAASAHLQMRLSYHPLSRQYRLSTGLLQRNFASIDEALSAMKRVRNWLVADRTVTFADADYEASVRFRLDSAMLPKPFQLSALTGREFYLETPWRRFTVSAPKHLPAPVETREPSKAVAK